MREENGHLQGDQMVNEPYTLWGSVTGHVTAVRGSRFYLRGTVYGDLTVLHGGRVHVFGNVTGTMRVRDGAYGILSGTIVRDCISEGSRLYLYSTARVMGKIIEQERNGGTAE